MTDAEKSKSTKASKIKTAGKPGEEKSPAKDVPEKKSPAKAAVEKKNPAKAVAEKKSPAKAAAAKKPPVKPSDAPGERQFPDFDAVPENYVNRELSWLEFNYRVLSEARDKSLPLFERLKFLSITASNLDEFYICLLYTSWTGSTSKRG